MNPKELIDSIETLRAKDTAIWGSIPPNEIEDHLYGKPLPDRTFQKIINSERIRDKIRNLEFALDIALQSEARANAHPKLEVPLH
jgi:hypothetical protein